MARKFGFGSFSKLFDDHLRDKKKAKRNKNVKRKEASFTEIRNSIISKCY
jgi:hypothetical protein